jgi:hypothetical protein
VEHTFSKECGVDHYHAIVVKSQLTRHIPELMPAIVDELLSVFADSFGNVGNGNPDPQLSRWEDFNCYRLDSRCRL